MIEISLTQNKITFVDDEDYSVISRYNWCAHKDGNTYYAMAYIPGSGKKHKKMIYLHRLIMNAQPEQQVDHINGNGLDNRRENLRFATRSQNRQNQFHIRGSSKYKGVTWSKRDSVWVSRITVGGKIKFTGNYKNEEDAAKAYDKAAIEYFGEFARLNFPQEVINASK